MRLNLGSKESWVVSQAGCLESRTSIKYSLARRKLCGGVICLQPLNRLGPLRLWTAGL